MSDCENSELDEKLWLNNWQIEQQRKLKEFQEAQRKLLDSEHEKFLSSLKTQNFDQRHVILENDPSHILNVPAAESDLDAQSKSSNSNYPFNFKSEGIKLKDPTINWHSIPQFSQCKGLDELMNNNSEDNEESEINKPRRFLKRGEGLARFRMTFDDFKSPPNIYREKRIKTYLNQKPEFNRKKVQNKVAKRTNEISRKNLCNKPRAVPVNVYVADNRSKNNCLAKSTSDPKSKEMPFSKAPMRSLTLKPIPPSNCSKNSLEVNTVKKSMEKAKEVVKSADINFTEKQMKKDERELRMFEMLEGKLDEGSLSPNSSLVARFMEESLCSTPSKQLSGEQEKDNPYCYIESLRALQRCYLTPEQIEKIQEFSEDCVSAGTENGERVKAEDKISDTLTDNISGLALDIDVEDEGNNNENIDDDNVEWDVTEKNEKGQALSEEMSEKELTPLLPQSLKANKTLLQEYIENFKKLKNEVKESYRRSDCEDIDELTSEEKPVNDEALSQREIAIKLQRKALQDNVKNILNWEGPSRKKPQKKLAKKIKLKPVKMDKSKKIEKKDDKVILNSSLLNDRLEQLEKEIEIFKKENRALTQLQKEYDTEKSRLEKERKEFERYMEQEREKFDRKISEEQKKLQRDKTVFDKYCKQIKNQPNKKEREEITNLKKEVERLTEVIVTKDARWGASQARLRNQIKSLEKENGELRLEIEKMKKQTGKKVTFENEKNINTKIIHTINSELDKLKPFSVKKGNNKQKYQSLTARVDSNLAKKPIRRTKSVPDLKKTSDKGIMNCDNDLLPIISVQDQVDLSSTGNGVKNFEAPPSKREADSDVTGVNCEVTEMNFSCFHVSNKKDIPEHEIRVLSEEKKRTREDCEKNIMETVLRETFFDHKDRGDHNGTSETISEIKRRLENLNLLHHSCSFNGEGDKKKCDTSRNHTVNCENDETSCSNDEEEDEENTVDLGDDQSECVRKNSTCFNYLCQTKVDHNGIREKTYEDGRREIIYPNGNVKKISADAKIVKMIYYNGDLKETDVAEGSEKYYYAETKTWHTTYKDGLEVLEFPNGQTERRHPDGSTEILFPNGCVRYSDFSGKDEWRFLDGTVVKTDKNGHKVLLLPNGQKEIHAKDYKRREYPDGTVKLLYTDGTQETRYASGRVRLKDKEGKLVMDSGGIR